MGVKYSDVVRFKKEEISINLEASDKFKPNPPTQSSSSGSSPSIQEASNQTRKNYSKICPTYKKLMRSGKINSSVSISESFENLNITSNKNSPALVNQHQAEGSVHWGKVADFSGVQTPQPNILKRDSVIISAPPLRKSVISLNRHQSLPDVHKLSSPPLNQAQFETPKNYSRNKKVSSTNPFWLTINKIPVVSTPSSTVSSVFSSPIMSDNQSKQAEAEQEMRHTKRLLVREINEFTVDDVCASRLPVLEKDLSDIKKLKNEYQDLIEDYIDQYIKESDSELCDRWRNEITIVGKLVKDHARLIRDKKEELFPTQLLSAVDKRTLEIQEETLKLKQKSLDEKQKLETSKQNEKLEESRLAAETEANLVLGECSVLGDIMPDKEWKDLDDNEISEAVRNIAKWQDQMLRIERSYKNYENMALKHKFSDEKIEAVKSTFEEIKAKYEANCEALKEEDSDRGLFTLEPSRTDIIKYPNFSGAASQDYLKFKETMEQRFRENKVRKKEQVAKLRECLSGSALSRVPDGVSSIDEAFKRLSEAFGNPSKIMDFNLKSLVDLGMMPPDKLPNGQPNFAKKIEWLLKMEVILAKIIELSGRSSKLAHEAFSSSTYRKLWARFPTNVIDKLVKVPGEDAERMQGILDKITKLREHSQVMDDECGSTTVPGKKTEPAKVTVEVFFRSAQRFDDCRVCTHIEATTGAQPGLYENHLSNYATGCPKFIEASTEFRKNIANKIKLCRQCFHPDVIFNKDHISVCPFAKKKNNYSCRNKNCKEHMWICLLHKRENKESMEKFKKSLQRKGLILTYTADASLSPAVNNAQLLNQAVRKIRRVEKKKGVEIVPVPEGRPMFLFHPTQGKTHAVNTFYDSGCSHAVFENGIPGQQLRGQIVNKGPFSIDGVGGLVTSAMDEWVVSVPRTDGKKQLIQGLTVARITSDFPLTQLEAAIQEIKADDPSNKTLQNCKAPPTAGGHVHMLLGIKYISVFPKEVHTLPSGLTIYESRLASHGGLYNACIGGPHSSFAALAAELGGTARLIAHFIDGLKTFRDFGPPRIKTLDLSQNEEELNSKYCHSEVDMEEISQYLEEKIYQNFVSCSHCFAEVASDERIREFKKHQDMHDSGLEVSYRCPRCRECLDCKTAESTEKISIREEIEMHEIQKSVHLDFANNKIQCSLPLRGKERDYLASNRDRALKVINQQIKKYGKDEFTKKTILEAFDKLFKNGHAKLLSQLLPEETIFLNKEVQHHLIWRVVFSGSVTTPTRPVMDASARTPFRKDGSGGKSLNDLVCKGKIESLNLIKVLLRFVVGKAAFTGDLRQFYNACKLNNDQWNLQRFLWVENLDPDGEIIEAVMTTLIYGVASVSAQTEFAMLELADLIEESNPDLALFLRKSRYVDDLQESKTSQQKCLQLAQQSDNEFNKLGLSCKAWTFSGMPPSPTVSNDGLSVSIFGGFSWFSEIDILELKFPRLHFSKPRRGRVPLTVKYFDGCSVEDMELFVPNPLSKRQAASKVASLWDLLGHLTPIMPKIKIDLRETFKQTSDWDSPMPLDLRQRWVSNFWLIEQLRGLKFTRAIMPAEAINSNMRLLTSVDAAKPSLIMGCWGGFKMRDGTWSNQLVLGRCLLSKNESIPKSELDALCGGSNMSWVVRLALADWVTEDYLFGDSMISLCWLTSEKLRLELFHRNRVLQIRRGTELSHVFYVRTDLNPADCGTRPDKVKLSDLGPDSKWECGEDWMNLDIENAVSQGFIKPVSELRLSKEFEDEYKEGLVFGDRDEVFLHAQQNLSVHLVSEVRVKKILQRTEFSDYLIIPTKFSFPVVVRIYGYVLKFITNARKGKPMQGPLLRESNLWFSVFPCKVGSVSMHFPHLTADQQTDSEHPSLLSLFALKNLAFEIDRPNKQYCILTDTILNQALLYLFRKGSLEVKKFVSKQIINKVCHEVEGILLSKGRLIDGMNFVETAELDFNLGSLGVKINIPVLDRFSPLSYSIAQHVHWKLGNHKGIETTNRLILEHVCILQGMTLCRELAEECIRCHMKRKKLLEVPMGPISEDQLIIAPPFYVTMLDLCGPFRAYVPGFERETRNRRAIDYKLYIMVSVCVTTKIVNLQVLESKSADSIIEGFSRLCAEVGIPSMVHVDLDSGALAGFKSAELDFKDLQHRLWTQYGVSFATCPKGGHDQHGLVERVIRSVKETFLDAGVDKMRIHSLGWQTFAKIAENAYNNIPIGFSYSRSHDNTELLKIITPNMLRLGRLNTRAMNGPIRLPTSTREILTHVETVYKAWFKVFKDVVVPRLIAQPKWFKMDEHLKSSDLVYFQKDESDLRASWTLGQVDQVVASRDGLIRRAIIKYFNAGDETPQFTDRSVRKLVKLWSIDESNLFDDLHEVGVRLKKKGEDGISAVMSLVDVQSLAGFSGSWRQGSSWTVLVAKDDGSGSFGFESLSCDLREMVMKSLSCMDELSKTNNSEERMFDLTTLAGVIQSTNVNLE